MQANGEILRVLRSPWAHAPIGAAIILLPALINGFPFWFYDTANYHHVGQSILSNVTEMLASRPSAENAATGATTNAAPAESGGGNAWLHLIGGRSPVYSLLLCLAAVISSYWIVAVVQAACAAWLISASLRAFALNGARPFLIVTSALTALSTLPYFSAMLMPDVFTGFTFVLTMALFGAAERIGKIERVALALALAAAIVMHQTNLPLAIMLVALLSALSAWARLHWRTIARRAAWAGAPILLAVAFNMAYAAAVSAKLGAPPSNPPYLMARVLEDGPGRLYLQEACAPQPQYELCRYADRPLDNANDFLWNDNLRVAVFMHADAETQRRLQAEERRFVIGAVSHFPLLQLKASVANAFEQLLLFQVRPELSVSRESWERMGFAALAPRDDASARASLAFRGADPFAVVDLLNGAALLAALGFLAWRLTRRDVRAALLQREEGDGFQVERALVVVAVALVLWLVANAVLCGAFSGVFARYQARTAWLTPMLAIIVLLRLGWTWRERAPQDGESEHGCEDTQWRAAPPPAMRTLRMGFAVTESTTTATTTLERPTPTGVELTILMPCLNEAETIAVCVEKAMGYLARSGVSGEVVIADNGSTDGSQEIAAKLGARVVPVPRRGYGAALLGGIEAARGRYIIMGDADDSYDFTALDAFVEQLRDGADLVMGNRFRGGIAPGAMPPLHYYLGNPVLSFLGRMLFQIPVGDFHCGLRGFSAAAIRELGLSTTGMEFASEMVVRASLAKLDIREVPTTLKPDGRTREPHLKTWRDGWRHLKFLLMFSPKWLFLIPGGLLAAVGATLVALLATGATGFAGGLQLDLNTFAAACFMVICGVQLISFGVVARTYASISGLLPRGPRSDWIRRALNTDNVMRLAAVALVAGLGLMGFALASWAELEFGDIVSPLVPRAVIGGLSLIVIAVQAACQAFMVGILAIPIKARAD